VVNLNNIVNIINTNDNLVLNMCFENEEGYVGYTPDISNEVEEELTKISSDYIERNADLEQHSYNPSITLSNTIEVCSIDEYNGVRMLIDTLNDNSRVGTIIPEDINFFVYEFHKNNEKVYVVRRHKKNKSIRKGFFGKLFNNGFHVVDEENVLTIDDKVDFFIYENSVVIFYHTAFERIFKLSNEFVERAEDVLGYESFEEGIKNFGELKEELLRNMNYVKRISRLTDLEKATLFVREPGRTQRVIKEFGLDIEYEDKKIVYSDKQQLGDFVYFMQDAFYRTLIGEDKSVDEGK